MGACVLMSHWYACVYIHAVLFTLVYMDTSVKSPACQ